MTDISTRTGRTISPSCTTPAASRPAIRSSAPIPATTGCGTTDAAMDRSSSITCTTFTLTMRGLICRKCTFPTLSTARSRTATATATASRVVWSPTAPTTSATTMFPSPAGRAAPARTTGTRAMTPARISVSRSSSAASTTQRRNGRAPARRPRKPTPAGAS